MNLLCIKFQRRVSLENLANIYLFKVNMRNTRKSSILSDKSIFQRIPFLIFFGSILFKMFQIHCSLRSVMVSMSD